MKDEEYMFSILSQYWLMSVCCSNSYIVMTESMECNSSFKLLYVITRRCLLGKGGIYILIGGILSLPCVQIPFIWGVLDTLCDEVCHWIMAYRWFSRGIPVSPLKKRTATIWLKYCWKWR